MYTRCTSKLVVMAHTYCSLLVGEIGTRRFTPAWHSVHRHLVLLARA